MDPVTMSIIEKIQLSTSLLAWAKKRLHRILIQRTHIDNRLQSLLRRHEMTDRNSLKESITRRIAVTEGFRNMLNKWAQGRSRELVRLQRSIVIHERELIEHWDRIVADSDSDGDDDEDLLSISDGLSESSDDDDVLSEMYAISAGMRSNSSQFTVMDES